MSRRFCFHIRNMSVKALNKIGEKALSLSSDYEYMHLTSHRHSKTSQEKAHFSSSWTLAEKTYAKEVIIWQQYFIAIPSLTANRKPCEWIFAKPVWHDLKQGPRSSGIDFWQNECTWKPSELVKGKKLQEKNELLPNFWMSSIFPQLSILCRKRSKINNPHSLILQGSEAVLRSTRSAKLPS